MGIGTWELVVILLAVLLLFGGKKIPEVARGLGKGIREFKKAANDIRREIELSNLDDNNQTPAESPPPPESKSSSPDKSPTSTGTESSTPVTSTESPPPEKPENDASDASRNS